MKRSLIFIVIILMSIPSFVFSQDQAAIHEKEINNINEVAKTMSQYTGNAVNPLLATAFIGIVKNITASSETRAQLPWFYQMWFIALCIILVLISYILSIGSDFNIPPQVAEIVEIFNKVLGLAITTPIIFTLINSLSPEISNKIQASFIENDIYVYASAFSWLAQIPLIIWKIIVFIMLFFVYISIWIFNSVFDVFVFLCPFGWLHTFLKIIRGIFYTLLLILTAIYPPLALILIIPIIIVSVLFYGWAVRRLIMGFVFIKDFLCKKKETVIDDKGILVFSEAGFGMPKKRMGRLKFIDDKWSFAYRKYFMFKKTLLINKTESVLKKGFIYSDIRDKKSLVCSLPPRYQKKAEGVQFYLGIEKLEDTKLKKGLKAMFAWIKNLFSGSKKMMPEYAS